MNFLSCHGPLGVDQVALLTHRGQDTRHMKKQQKRNTHKWQEVTKDNKAFISNSAREAESEGHTGWELHPEGRRSWLRAAERAADRITQIHQSIIHPSVQPVREGANMKRPHDYSSPDSDTDEFIDVGQEDGYWWASANHTWGCNTCPPITL